MQIIVLCSHNHCADMFCVGFLHLSLTMISVISMNKSGQNMSENINLRSSNDCSCYLQFYFPFSFSLSEVRPLLHMFIPAWNSIIMSTAYRHVLEWETYPLFSRLKDDSRCSVFSLTFLFCPFLCSLQGFIDFCQVERKLERQVANKELGSTCCVDALWPWSSNGLRA